MRLVEVLPFLRLAERWSGRRSIHAAVAKALRALRAVHRSVGLFGDGGFCCFIIVQKLPPPGGTMPKRERISHAQSRSLGIPHIHES